METLNVIKTFWPLLLTLGAVIVYLARLGTELKEARKQLDKQLEKSDKRIDEQTKINQQILLSIQELQLTKFKH